MRKGSFLIGLISGLSILAASAGVAALGSVAASAAQSAGNETLTLTPVSGLDQTVLTLDTSAPCPASADSYNVIVSGPNNFNGTITGTTSAGLSTTAPFQTQFGQSMLTLSQVIGVPIVAGQYDVTLQCLSGFPFTTVGTFTGAMTFSDATHYTVPGGAVTPPPTSTTSTTPPTSSTAPTLTSAPSTTETTTTEPSTTTSGTTSASDTSTSTTDLSVVPDTGTSTNSDGGASNSAQSSSLPNTGSPIRLMFIVGLILLAIGLLLTVVLQRRKTGPSHR